MRKPVFGVSDQVSRKPGCTTTQDGWRLEISDIAGRGIVLPVYIAKTKALISYADTAQLTCVFVFAYAKSRFSHNEAQGERTGLVVRASDSESGDPGSILGRVGVLFP